MSANAVIPCLGLFVLCAVASAQIPFTVAEEPWDWELGNHRAVVRVEDEAEAVWAHIAWRRHDAGIENKNIVVIDAESGERIDNRVIAQVNREAGDIVFQPKTVPGAYYVYYLPCKLEGWQHFGDYQYMPPEDAADDAWVEAHGLGDEELAAGQWRQLPRANVERLEARTEFDKFHPREVIATEEETAALLDAHADSEYLIFCEDREHEIRMDEHLPRRWIERGPQPEFRGYAQPGEYCPFQIGIWAAGRAIDITDVELSALRSADGNAIPASALTCFNIGGVDWLGRSFDKTVHVEDGAVQALWVGVDVPELRGVYEGEVRVHFEELPAAIVPVHLRVRGEAVEESGDDDLWRLSRLRWLNSQLAIDDEVIPPYTPLQLQGNTVSCLGREVAFTDGGLPGSIVTHFDRSKVVGDVSHGVLARPIELSVESPGEPVTWRGQGMEAIEKTDGRLHLRATAGNDSFRRVCDVEMEFDGCLTFTVDLEAREDVDVSDVALVVPVRRQIATYMMGLGKRGGDRPEQWEWQWNKERANNMVWLGNCDAGVQVKLMSEDDEDQWEGSSLATVGLPESWHNEGKGGARVYESGDEVIVRAYTGPKRMSAGEHLQLRFRLLITPFKPIDERHWDWRVGNVWNGGNIQHVHHASTVNPYINYPFLTIDELAALKERLNSVPPGTDGKVIYPAEGNIDLESGSLHIWATVNFDPQVNLEDPKYRGMRKSAFNEGLFNLAFANQDAIGFYWNIDDRGMRAYVRTGAPEKNQYPILFGSHLRQWQKGERHHIVLSWGERMGIFVDGRRVAGADYAGTVDTSLEGAQIELGGGLFTVDAIKISDAEYSEGEDAAPTADERTLFLDTFADISEGQSDPQVGRGPGRLEGNCKIVDTDGAAEIAFVRGEAKPKDICIYYTVRELSNRVAEMWPLRSLNHEIFTGGPGGGHTWLQEHLVDGYAPAWHHPFGDGRVDAAIRTVGLSRWHNYYIRGMQYLMQHTGIGGLYLDGIGYDRQIMKRIAKVMHRNDPDYHICHHSGNTYDSPWGPGKVSAINMYMEHLPYISWLWYGELYDYNRAPDYWLVEMSGIPFGLTGEMLNYQTGGNAYRGMVYGMSGRQHPSHEAMWRFWDEFGIEDAEMIGYWEEDCPVRTDRDDVLATVYKKDDAALISLASWPKHRTPQANVNRAEDAPRIDGDVGDEEWQGAARLTNFVQLGGSDPAQDQTDVYVTHDEEKLYVGFHCEHSHEELRAEATEHDAEVWKDDAVEVFVQPDPEQDTYYQFIGNSVGASSENRNNDITWDADWEFEASVGDGYWQGEMRIAFSELGMEAPVEGQRIGINFCRDQQVPAQRLSSWAPASGSFHDTDTFGHLVLSEDEPPTRQERAEGTQKKNVRLKINWDAVGISPHRAVLTAPYISRFQRSETFAPDEAIPVQEGKGWLLVLSEERGR